MEEAKYHTEHVDQASSGPEENASGVRAGVYGAQVESGYWKSPRFLGSCLAIVLLANNLFFGYSVPANILSVINADIGPSDNKYLVTLVNTLIKGICLLLVGSISDLIGRRYFIIGGQVCGFIGAVISAKATSINVLIGASVFTGIAGSAQVLYPLLSQEIVPNKYRGWSQGIITLLVLPGIGFGPIIARTMIANIEHGWRWCYWLNAILTAISLLLFMCCYFPPDFSELQNSSSRKMQVRRIDYFGFLVYGGGLFCLLLGLSWGGQQYPWSSSRVIALVVIGIFLLIAFVLFETYAPLAQPLLPMSLFKIRNFTIALVVGSVGQMAFYAQNVLWPTQVQDLYTQNNRLVGWMSCTTGLALTMGEIISGPALKPLGNVKWQLVIAAACLTLFGGLLVLGNEHRPGVAIAITSLMGLSIRWIELVTIVVIGLVVPPERIGTGQAFFASTRAVCGTIATSIYLAIYDGGIRTNLPEQITKYVLQAGMPQSSVEQVLKAATNGTTAAIEAVPAINTTIIAALRAGEKRGYAMSLEKVYLATIGFGGTALILSFFASDVDQYLTDFVNKTVVRSKAVADHEKS